MTAIIRAYSLFHLRQKPYAKRVRIAYGGVRLVCCVLGIAWVWVAFAAEGADELDAAKLPPVWREAVSFGGDIRPIFEQSCIRCHGPARPKSRFRLDEREAALKGGENGVDIIPGNSGKSP